MAINDSATGGAIRDRRKAQGLSQEALAREANCSLSMLRLLEGGYRPGESDVLERLEMILTNDVRPDGESGRDVATGHGGRRCAEA